MHGNLTSQSYKNFRRSLSFLLYKVYRKLGPSTKFTSIGDLREEVFGAITETEREVEPKLESNQLSIDIFKNLLVYLCVPLKVSAGSLVKEEHGERILINLKRVFGWSLEEEYKRTGISQVNG